MIQDINVIFDLIGSVNVGIEEIDRKNTSLRAKKTVKGVLIPVKKRDLVTPVGSVEGYSATFLTAEDLDENKWLKLRLGDKIYDMKLEYSKFDGIKKGLENLNHSSFKLREVAG